MTYDVTSEVDAVRVARTLTGMELHHSVDHDGEVYLVFSSSTAGVPDVSVTVTVENDVLAIRGRPTTAYPAEAANRGMVLINDYSHQRRWPTAHLEWRDADQPVFRVIGEVHVPVDHGLTDAQLEQHLELALRSINVLCGRVHEALTSTKNAELPSAEELEAWLE